MRRSIGWALGAAALLAGCETTPPPRPIPVAPPLPPPLAAGLDRVMGHDARALIVLFGAPDLDVREGAARKLQFTSAICVLDAYLYPPAAGGESVVRYIDARRPSGEDIDRASCIAALSRRTEAR